MSSTGFVFVILVILVLAAAVRVPLHVPLLVEDLLRVSVAHEQHDGHEEEEQSAPAGAVAEAQRPLATAVAI